MDSIPRPGSVFISYKREEASIAEVLHDALVEEGFDVWWDEDLQCGQAWAEKLDEAVREAACIIVLWSERSVASQWVRHEASQATARGVYAPCRIGLVQLKSPYDRIQATDLIDWDGDRNHGGYKNLLQRVDTLVPAPVPLPRRIGRWLRFNFATLVASSIALFAIWLLVTIFLEQRADRLEKVYDCSASAELRTELALARYSRGESLAFTCLLRGDFSNANLRDANLSGVDLSKAKLSGADLRNAKLIDVNLEGANLDTANLSKAQLDNVDLTRANLETANLSEALLDKVDLTDAYLLGANLSKAHLSKVDLPRATLAGVNLEGAALRWVDLKEAQLGSANLREANLNESNLSKAKLESADLRKVKLIDVNLEGANLYRATLKEASLNRTSLMKASLYRTNLSGATLNESNFIEASLRMVNLKGASLYWTNLTGANLTQVNFAGAEYTADTMWPENFDPEAAGAILIADKGAPSFSESPSETEAPASPAQ